MIYPNITSKKWIEKFPALYELKRKCQNCKKSMVANKPFIEKHWVGLESEDCSCGTKAISISTPNPNSDFKKKIENWFKNF